ncbi:MAG: hypothetical protein QOH26_1169 [Actinomycetota bacterium]|nr:hypothetical protein [Actinomycetota bacterium]
MFVANAEGGTVTILDGRTFTKIRTINVIPEGTEPDPAQDPAQAAAYPALEEAGGKNYAQDLDVSPDGKVLYVSRGHFGDVMAFDIKSGEKLWRVDVSGIRSDHMTLSDDGRLLYVSAIFENKVEIIDTKKHEIVGSFPTGEWPHDNVLSPDGQIVYNGSMGNVLTPGETRDQNAQSYVLTVANAINFEVLKTYEFNRGIRPFVLTANGRRMYAQLSEFHGLVEVSLRTGRILRRLRLPVKKGITEEDYDFEAPHHGLALSPDEKYLCVAGRASDYVAIVSRRRMKAVKFIRVDDAPGWAENSPNGRRCVVTSTRANTVSAISYRTKRKVAEVKVGRGPKYLTEAWLPESVLRP